MTLLVCSIWFYTPQSIWSLSRRPSVSCEDNDKNHLGFTAFTSFTSFPLPSDSVHSIKSEHPICCTSPILPRRSGDFTSMEIDSMRNPLANDSSIIWNACVTEALSHTTREPAQVQLYSRSMWSPRLGKDLKTMAYNTLYRPPYTTVTHVTSVPQPLTTKMTCFYCLNSWHFHWFVEVPIKHESFHGKTGPQNWGTKPNSSSKSSWQIPGSATCRFFLALLVFISCLKMENTQKGWKKTTIQRCHLVFVNKPLESLLLEAWALLAQFFWHKMAGWW